MLPLRYVVLLSPTHDSHDKEGANITKPTAAKIADVFGRLEVLVASVVLYVLGK